MNKTKKKHIIYFSSVVIFILISISVYFLIFNKPNNDNNVSDNFSLSPTLEDIEKIKEQSKDVQTIDGKNIYVVEGNYNGLNGNYTYHIDEKNNVLYSDFRTEVFAYDMRFAYDDLSEEEKNKIISEGYQNITKTMEYFTKTLNYNIVSVVRVPINPDEKTTILKELPDLKTLQEEFSISKSVSCYIIEFITPEKEKLSMSISSQGFNSIYFILTKN